MENSATPEEQTTPSLQTNNRFKRFLGWLRMLVRITDDTDVEATISSITNSIELKGVNIWILAFAIIVASVGLNVNSTAVIIGAMLISPLMSPINGIGLAIGITDRKLLKKSLQHLGVMVLISLTASFTYFLLSPLGDAQSELLARTRPTIFDVLIAFFGGLAGIVAISRKSQPFTVISGVAIATALMPPLCTAGYGLASAQFKYFFGAFYLFFINSFFIALATFLIVRYLHFPQTTYLDPEKARSVKRSISIFSLIVIIPSIFIAFDVIKETSFNSQANKFINDIQETTYFNDTQLITSRKEYSRKNPSITISLIGKELSENQIQTLQNMLHRKYGLKKTKLIVKQTSGIVDITSQSTVLQDILNKKEQQMASKDSLIHNLEVQLHKISSDSQIYHQVAKEIAVQYPMVKTFAISDIIYTHTHTLVTDTIPTLFITYSNEFKPEQKAQLIKWLKVRLELPKLELYQ